MNEYKITYTSDPAVTGGTGTFTMSVTDRTEAAAKKFFRETAKECGRVFQSIELLRTDAPATKRNERDTLEVIRQLVADLGEQSYLATAFEGCFEIAEQNIEYDWGCSQKQFADAAAEKVTELEAEIKRLRDQLAESEKNYEAARAANDALDEKRASEIAALQSQVLSVDELYDIQVALEERVKGDEEEASKAAAEIVSHADAPDSMEFLEARNAYHIAKNDAEVIQVLLDRVKSIRTSAGA